MSLKQTEKAEILIRKEQERKAAFCPRGEGEREKPVLRRRNREEQQVKDERLKEGTEHEKKIKIIIQTNSG